VNDGALERLIELLAKSELSDEESDFVLAAAYGPDVLGDLLAGGAGVELIAADHQDRPQSRAAYLGEITVEGFRGVGPAARLPLQPGPGLTLVVGRNGSGKSSFAEALEVLLTGTTLRWAERTKVWQEGWSNLHHDGQVRVAAKFWLDGDSVPLTVSRMWPHGGLFDDGGQPHVDGPVQSWDDLGWNQAIDQFRPMLSYNELGTMFSSRAAALYEALSVVLGLEDFDQTLATLRQARLDCERTGKDEKQARTALRSQLGNSVDPRAITVGELLGKPKPDADAVLASAGAAVEPDGSGWTSLVRLELPTRESITHAFASLESADHSLRVASATDADRLDALAALLQGAVDYRHRHSESSPADCPVCGAGGRLDESWVLRSEAEISELRLRSAALTRARLDRAAAATELHNVLRFRGVDTALVTLAVQRGFGPADIGDRWSAWVSAFNTGEAAILDHGPERVAALAESLEAVQSDAERELRQQDDAWRPLRDAILAWRTQYVSAQKDAVTAKALKQAEGWLSSALVDLRRERLAPVVDAAKENWSELRHESNVTLGNVELRKSGNQRFAAFDVAIDGADASAFGVMSQGELSALAISVFLPRAMLPGSPFGFVVIDDPVQSMDPAKVDGLARVLARTAGQRQVIVFTHDERLPEAIRRLAIDARIIRVQRRAQSKVELVASAPPSDRYIGEAFALAKATNLPEPVRTRVIPGFCRSAIEAACEVRIRRRLIGEGVSHADIDLRIGSMTAVGAWLADALEVPLAQGQLLRTRIEQLAGQQAVTTFDLVRKGAHVPVVVEPGELIAGARRLVRALEAET
jgi:predicted ATPase